MEAKKYSRGVCVDYTPVGAVAAGEVVVVGGLVGAAIAPIAAGVTGSVRVSGVFHVPATIDSYTVGQLVYWSDADNFASALSEVGELLGKVVRVFANGEELDVLLTP